MNFDHIYEKPERAKVCYNCNEFVLIFPDNPTSMEKIKLFDVKHTYHMTQIIGMGELDRNRYKPFEA